MPKVKTVKLKVPEGAEVGDSLTFAVNGNELEIPIPEGSNPGDVLQLQIQVDDKDEDEDEEENSQDSGVTRIQLHSSVGVTLEIHNEVPCTKVENNEKKDGADGTFAMAWPAGIHLAKEISSPSLEKMLEGTKTVVELGSGSGLCGLAYAATVSSRLSKRKADVKKLNILLTDMPSALNLLEYNVKMNRDRLSSQMDDDNLRVEPLTWGKQKEMSISSLSHVDLILGSDLLYKVSIETLKALSTTIQAIDRSGKAQIILGVRWRKPEEERVFFQEMENNGYKFQLLIEESLYACNLSWNEFGNPKCKRSNDFFTNSFAEVEGQIKALKDVSEDDMDVMSDAEFDAYERRFIQIYLGQKEK